jgi:prepilin-type N-terminal cleavage/methylation domain-containing protein
MKSHNLYNQLNKKSGFTLVELAIVIVVIGLLVGGVLQGQELIKQAKLRAVINEQKNFERAVYSFQSKYNALPGDMPNAFQFFGANCGADTTDDSVGCNGDGNGIIEGYYPKSEGVKAWEHLS